VFSGCVFVFSTETGVAFSLQKVTRERERDKEGESFSTPKDKTGDYLRKKRAVEAWKRAIQFRPFGTCIMVCPNYRFFAFYYVFV